MKIRKLMNPIAVNGILMVVATAHGSVLNDQCTSAVSVGTGFQIAKSSNLSASLNDEAEAGCQPDSQGDVWFAYTASCIGQVTIDTFGSGQSDTVLSVLSACGGAEVACNDDFEGELWSRVAFNATAGQNFRIRLASVGPPGDYKLNIACLETPDNDTCASASFLFDGQSAAIGNNQLADATDDTEAGCQEFSQNDVWFTYTAPCTGKAVVDTLGTTQSDPILSIYETCGGAEIACNDDSDGGLGSRVSFDATVGQMYRVRLASVGETGDYRLNTRCVAIPENDSCALAASMTDGTVALGNNLLAGASDDAEAECQALTNYDVWFEYTASCSGRATIDTLGSLQTDPVLSIYETCGGLELACNDDSNDKLQAALSFAATEGQSYRVRLASVGDPGEYILNAVCHSFPTNDHCASATAVTNGTPAFSGNNLLAETMDDTESTCQSLSDYDVWFTYQSACDGAVIFDTLGSGQDDTTLTLFDGCSGIEIACGDDARGTLHAEVSIPATIGQSYRIRLASVGQPGDYHLNIECVAAPTNDACASATTLTDGAPAFQGNNLLAGSIDEAEAACQPDSGGDVWFQYTSTCAGVVTIDTAGSTQPDSVLSVLDGCGGMEIACNDDSDGSLQSRVMFNATVNQAVWIRLASVGQPGEFKLNVECASTPANEACLSAALISDGAPAVTGSNLLASVGDDRESECQPVSDGDIWFQYVASCTGEATIDTLGSGQSDTVLTAYESCSGPEAACNDDAAEGLHSAITLDVVGGTSYFIRLASAGAPGAFKLNVSCLGVPMNDTCASAVTVSIGSPAATGNNFRAADDDDETASCGSGPNSDVWFHFVATCTTPVLVDTFGSGQSDTILSVHAGCGGAEIACNDDTGGGLLSALSFDAMEGQSYWIRIGSVGSGGPFVLGIAAPSCDVEIAGDFDGDLDVDLDDYDAFATCFTGPGSFPIPAACEAGEFEGCAASGCTGDIDCTDWEAFKLAWTDLGLPPQLPQCGIFGDVNEDGIVDVDDILCVLDAFVGDYLCLGALANADLAPCGGNGLIDLDDLLSVLDAFMGIDLCP